MKSGLRAYFDLIFSELDCYATWLPGTGVAIGDIGRISESGSFLRTGDLSNRAELPLTRTEQEPDQVVSTRGGVTFSSGASVKTDDVVQMLASAGATLDITFGGAAAAALIMREVVRHEFVDEQPVTALMASMLAAETLHPDEVVVTYVKEAGSGVVATTYDAQAGLDVEVDATVGKGALRIASVGGHLKVVSQLGSQTVVTADQGKPLTPVYRALAFRRNRRWWSFWNSWLEIKPVIPTRSFGIELADPDDILPARPSRAVRMGATEDRDLPG
jgi:hypothetical protein